MTWALLILAILLEVGGTTLLKLSNGFAQPLYAAGALLLYGICFYLLAIVMQHIPMGIAYAIWSAFGIVCILAIGILLGQRPDLPALIGIALIVAGTCVIHLFSRMHA